MCRNPDDKQSTLRINEIKMKAEVPTCNKCGKTTVYREYTTDIYHLEGQVCLTCGYYLIINGWVDSFQFGKYNFKPEATS